MSEVFFGIVATCAATAVIQQFFSHSRGSQRHIYWSCACIGAIAAFFAFYPDVRKGSGMALFFLGVMVAAAYFYTPYIKIRGKVFALNAADSRPDPDDKSTDASTESEHDPAPDAYSGLLTARKMWWIITVLTLISAGNIYHYVDSGVSKNLLPAAIGVVFITFFGVVLGLGDASWGYGIARGQKIQFAVVTIITAATFAVIYLAAYWIGKHKPVRRKQSMEYRAHPRHQREPDQYRE